MKRNLFFIAILVLVIATIVSAQTKIEVTDPQGLVVPQPAFIQYLAYLAADDSASQAKARILENVIGKAQLGKLITTYYTEVAKNPGKFEIRGSNGFGGIFDLLYKKNPDIVNLNQTLALLPNNVMAGAAARAIDKNDANLQVLEHTRSPWGMPGSTETVYKGNFQGNYGAGGYSTGGLDAQTFDAAYQASAARAAAKRRLR